MSEDPKTIKTFAAYGEDLAKKLISRLARRRDQEKAKQRLLALCVETCRETYWQGYDHAMALMRKHEEEMLLATFEGHDAMWRAAQK